MKPQTIFNVVVALALVVVGFLSFGGGSLFGTASVNVYEAGVRWTKSGLYVGSSQQFSVDSTGNVTTTGGSTVGGATSLAALTVNGLYTYSPSVVATTTTGSNSRTLSQADLLAGQYYTVNINAAADHTFTLPATSTLTSFLANTGESTEICFNNATTAAGIDLIFAAGTGIDLESGTTSLKALPTSTACIEFLRKANTDVTAIFKPNADAD